MSSKIGTRSIIGLALGLGLLSLALAAATGGLSPSFIDPDESAHYVNTLFIADWLRAGLPSPMPFARDFYAHFPKLSIGHWPPGWYALLAPGFALVRPSPFGAALLGAFVAGLPAALAGWGLNRAGMPRLAIGAAIAVLLLPLSVESARFFLLDQPVALVAGLAAIAWLVAAERPSWGRYALFGALAAFATLVKGNGALAVLVPAIEIALSGRWRLLRDPRLWVVGAATVLVLAPWYVVSFKLAADGFNYKPGLAYAWLSLASNGAALWADLGPIGLMLAAIGAAAGWRAARAGPVVRLALAVILATALLQAIVPVALQDRYVLPMLPWLMILAALGVRALWQARGAWRIAAPIAAAGALAMPLAALAGRTAKPDMGAGAIAARMAAAPGIWLVDGRAGGEGAMIAAAAYADGGRRRIWTARASQWLSRSDFMGRGYELTARTPAEAGAVLDRLGARGVVIVGERGRLAYPHSAVLLHAVRGPGYAGTQRRFPTGNGAVVTAVRRASVVPHPELLAMGSGSRNVAAVTR